MTNIAPKVVDIASALAIYGISGYAFVAGCGVGLVGATFKDCISLADEFSGFNGGHNVANFMLNQSQKVAESIIKNGKKLATSAINALANGVKSRL